MTAAPATLGAAGWRRRGANNIAALAAFGASHYFGADKTTLSGGNVATVLNQLGADTLGIAAGTLAAPASDPLFAGAFSLLFTGTQRMASSLPSSSWKFLHDGSGYELFNIFAPTEDVTQVSWSTRTAGTGACVFRASGGAVNHFIGNGGNAVLSQVGGNSAVGVASYQNTSYAATARIAAHTFLGSQLLGAGQQLVAPTSGNPDGTLTLGAFTEGQFPARMRWCGMILFPFKLHEFVRQQVREWIQANFGIAAPLLSGRERVVMSMLPVSWPCSATCETSGGKTVAIHDRALPGHIFTQSNPSLRSPAPEANALLGGKPLLSIAAGQHYQSNLPALAWRFMHTTGFDAVLGFVPTSSLSMVASTLQGTSPCGVQMYTETTAFKCDGYTVGGGAGQQFSAASHGTSTIEAPTFVHATFFESATPEVTIRRRGVTSATTTTATAPGTANPNGPLTIGAHVDGGFASGVGFFDLPIFDRELTFRERQQLNEFMEAEYGLAPLSVKLPANGPVRVMPTGDSITAGYTDNPTWSVPYSYGYRKPLYEMLSAAQPNRFTFVGASPQPEFEGSGDPYANALSSRYLADIGQNKHRGYGGQGIAWVNANVATWLAADLPHVVLLMVGINDISPGSSDLGGWGALLRTTLLKLFEWSPETHVVVAQIFSSVTNTPAITAYNAYIRDALVPELAAQGCPVSTVDQNAAFLNGGSNSASLFSNGVNHPQPDGYARIAATWAGELLSRYG